MKIIVATSRTQGQNPGDFNWLVDGELVTFAPLTCDRADCGCDRSWAGVASHKAGTTAEITDRPISRQDYVTAIVESFATAWPSAADDPEIRADVEAEALDLLVIADGFDIGDVVELHHDKISLRC